MSKFIVPIAWRLNKELEKQKKAQRLSRIRALLRERGYEVPDSANGYVKGLGVTLKNVDFRRIGPNRKRKLTPGKERTK